MLNQRLFGTPITGSVQVELERRQSGKSQVVFPNESIDTSVENFSLSEATPFVRMWTSVKFIEPERTAEVFKEFYTKAEYYAFANDPNLEMDELLDNSTALMKSGQYNRQNPGTKVSATYITLPNGEKKVSKYLVIADDDHEKGKRDKIEFAREIYTIGDYNYQESYGEYTANESIQTLTGANITTNDSSEDNESSEAARQLFPNELSNNKLLKPKAGITGITSETLGLYNERKQTTVNFMVHNFYDFDKIYNRYFLKPGATIFVDFGWSRLENLYKPEELITSNSIESFLYEDEPGKEQGVVEKSNGNLEVIQGIVTDYNAKILKNGSIDCSVTLTSSNAALLDFPIDNHELVNVKDFLQKGILYFGVQRTVEDLENNGDLDNAQDLIEKLQIPDVNTSNTNVENFDKQIELLSFLELGYTHGLVPQQNAVTLGVFVNDFSANDVFISIGFLEDFVFNSRYGFGKGIDDILKGKNSQVRLDSSYSFTTFDKLFYEKQRFFNMTHEEVPKFLYPAYWGDFENSDGTGGSLSYIAGKWPETEYIDKESNTQTADYFFKYDKELKRMPLRELFINVQDVVSSFEENKGKTVKDVILTLLEKINDNGDGLFDLKLIGGDRDNELKIIDNNYVEFSNKLDRVGNDENGENYEFKNLFTFKVMSPESIVKDYNLEFNLPQGNIGNIYSINAMSHENSLFPINNLIDDAIAINSLDEDSLSIVYEPDNGGYSSTRLNSKPNNTHMSDVYNNVDKLLSTDLYKGHTTRTPVGDGFYQGEYFTTVKDDWIEENTVEITDTKSDTPDKSDSDTNPSVDKIELNIKYLLAHGFHISDSFVDYYKLRQREEITLKNRPNLLPYKLSLTIYGISSLVPGDTFRIDYLPKMHLNNTYCQITKVSHNINSDGWFTVLDTVFRPLSDTKVAHYTDIDRKNIRLSPKLLNEIFNFGSKYEPYPLFAVYGENKVANSFTIWDIQPYITHLQVFLVKPDISGTEGFIDYVLKFQLTGMKPGDEMELKYTIYGESFYNIDYDDARAKLLIDEGYSMEDFYLELRNHYWEEGEPEEDKYYKYISPPNVKLTNSEPNKYYYMAVAGDLFFITDNPSVLVLLDDDVVELAQPSMGV